MSMYKSQDRGDRKKYQQYLESMDAISIEKVASASAFFEPEKGNTIVDVGMASGTSSAILAELFPDLNIIGVDVNSRMVDIANEMYRSPNLSYREDDGESLLSFQPQSVNGFFNCSTIHHITSYNGYDKNRALNTLNRQVELLKERGVIVIRDFLKPEEKEVILELSSETRPDRPDDCELLMQFSREARSLAPTEKRGFPILELSSQKTGTRRFRLFLTDATEFIRRKDYYANWEIELQEEYGYFSQKEFEQIFRNLGLRIIISTPIYNRWIINNRYKDQFRIYDLEENEIGYPPTNYLIAGEKITEGKHISIVRHLPDLDKPFLHFFSYKNKKTGGIYDLVSRPNEVIDIIPYYQHDDKIFVLAKHAYPRPLAGFESDNPNIDGKRFSGYITEGISIAEVEDLQHVLEKRFKIDKSLYTNVIPSLNYYTSPGGINEKVRSVFVELNSYSHNSIVLSEGFSGFKESGYLHSYNAYQLLTTAQTGALPEARLELNVYNLFNRLNSSLPEWLGEKIEPEDGFACNPVSFMELMDNKLAVFETSDRSAGFLKSFRAYFSESGLNDSSAVLEYVYPEKLSSNTLVTMPVNKINGELYIGLEERYLPVPQNYTGNCRLITIPAKRLPKNVFDFFELENYIREMNFDKASVTKFSKLGEKYFPSIGVTPEQVYPYVVFLDSASDNLKWVKASELFENMDRIEDAHTLICLSRFRHALKGVYSSK